MTITDSQPRTPRPGRRGRLANPVAAAGLALALVAALTGCGGGPDTPPPPPVPTEAASFPTAEIAAQAQIMRDAGAPAVLVEVRRGGEVWRNSLGVTTFSGGGQADPLAPVRIASVTKSMLGVVLLQLADDGDLDLDEPVADHLPELRLGREVVATGAGALALAAPASQEEPGATPPVPPSGLPDEVPTAAKLGDDVVYDAAGTAVINPLSRITPRMLAQHTAGLPDYIASFPLDDLNAVHRALTTEYELEELIGRVADAPWTSAPGGAFSYSNTNYLVLSLLVERLEGRPVADVLRDRVFAPGNLTATSLPDDLAMPEGAPHGYLTIDRLSIDVSEQSPHLFSGAGGVVSTVGDVNSFYRGLFLGTYLRPDRVREQLELNDSGYGIGIQGHPDPCAPGAPTLVLTGPDGEALASPPATSAPASSAPASSAPASSAPATSPPATSPPPSSSSPGSSPSPTDTAGRSVSPRPTTVQLGEPGMTYGHLGSGLGYRILTFSSPDGARQVTVAWTASPTDYAADPRLAPAYALVDAALTATCPTA